MRAWRGVIYVCVGALAGPPVRWCREAEWLFWFWAGLCEGWSAEDRTVFGNESFIKNSFGRMPSLVPEQSGVSRRWIIAVVCSRMDIVKVIAPDADSKQRECFCYVYMVDIATETVLDLV